MSNSNYNNNAAGIIRAAGYTSGPLEALLLADVRLVGAAASLDRLDSRFRVSAN